MQHTERVPLLALARCRPEHDGAALVRQLGRVLPEGGLAEARLTRHDQSTGEPLVEEGRQRRNLADAADQGPRSHRRTVVRPSTACSARDSLEFAG